MPGKPKVYRPPHLGAAVTVTRETDTRRGTAAERGYTWQWAVASAAFLRQHPLCIGCLARGRTEAATLTDHVIPHRGDMVLFWDRTKWQPSCDWHHNAVKQKLEALFDAGRIGADGLWLDSATAVAVAEKLRPSP